MPRSHRLKLSEHDRLSLIKESGDSRDKKASMACRAILLLADGRLRSEVAKECKVHAVTVGRWASRFRKHGLRGLLPKDNPRGGRPPKLQSHHLELLRKTALTPPEELAKPFRQWTLERLARYFIQQTGITIRGHYIGRLLKRMGVSWSGRHNQLEKRASSAWISEAVILWFVAASPKQEKSPAGRAPKQVLLAAINLKSGKVTEFWTQRRTAASFLQFLQRVLQDYALPKVILVAESGSVPLTRQVARFLETEQGRLMVIMPSAVSAANHKEEGQRPSDRHTIQFLFNSPEIMASKVLRAIDRISKHAVP